MTLEVHRLANSYLVYVRLNQGGITGQDSVAHQHGDQSSAYPILGCSLAIADMTMLLQKAQVGPKLCNDRDRSIITTILILLLLLLLLFLSLLLQLGILWPFSLSFSSLTSCITSVNN